MRRCPYLEFPFDPDNWTPERRDFMISPQDRPMIDDQGCLRLPEKPGLGFDLDQEALKRCRIR